MATDTTSLDVSIWEKLGDGLTAFSEGAAQLLTRILGSSNERYVRKLGYIRSRNPNVTHYVTPGSLPAQLTTRECKGDYTVTVNEYLARRDCEWMSHMFLAPGISCGFIQSDMDPVTRRRAYECDITYGTNSEFGFDYLRDNMKPARWGDPRYHPLYQQCQKNLNYAIIDEVDNILVDEARTPLIISGPAHDNPDDYRKANKIAAQLSELEKKAQSKLKELGHGLNIPHHPLTEQNGEPEAPEGEEA